MDLNVYQKCAVSTAIYPQKGSLLGKMYCSLKMNGEAGEVAEKVAKAFRDADGEFSTERRTEIIREMGDVLWYVAALAAEFNTTLQHVAEVNLDKIAQRKRDGTLHGDGDNR